MSARGARTLVKAKSMLTDECDMRPFLENRGIEIMETDLGERIQQLDDEPPSHIVVPAVHKLRTDVARVFAETIGTDPKNSDVHYLAESQRQHTRPYFLKADAGMTGANFAVAETGTIVVCTNEGNADLSVNLPKLYIASIGIEKVIPRVEHLGVFVRMLSRSALGSPITQLTSHFRVPREGTEMHVILVDNGRAERLGMPDFWYSLKCIRCGACMNTCPGLQAQRGPELWRDLLGTDRRHHRSDVQSAKIQRAALCLDAERKLHQRLPGQDQHPRADLQMAASHQRAQSTSADQEGSDADHGQVDVEAEALSRGGGGGRGGHGASATVDDVQPVNPWGRQREVPKVPPSLSPVVFEESGGQAMSSRDELLERVRRTSPPRGRCLTFPHSTGVASIDTSRRLSAWAANLSMRQPTATWTARSASSFPMRRSSARRCLRSMGNRPLDRVRRPHELRDVDVGVVRALFGVAQTGSVWVSETQYKVNALGIPVATPRRLLDPDPDPSPNMHRAYRERAHFDAGYGCS